MSGVTEPALQDTVLGLIIEALDELDSSLVPLSAVIRKAIRIARLRRDYKNLLWLQLEMVSLDDRRARETIRHDAELRYGDDSAFGTDFVALIARSMETRRMPKLTDEGDVVDYSQVTIESVAEIESKVQSLLDVAEASKAVNPRARLDARRYAAENRKVLNRIRQRVHEFLSITEEQLHFEHISANIFERNRLYVDRLFSVIAPGALAELNSAYQRLGEGDPEARSQALLSCRRVLKSLADTLYAPRAEPSRGDDRRLRDLGDEKYKNRLWQYISEKASSRRARQLLLAQAQDLGNRLDSIYAMESKGVHAQVTEFEANQCVIQTYLLIGDILHLSEEESLATSRDT